MQSPGKRLPSRKSGFLVAVLIASAFQFAARAAALTDKNSSINLSLNSSAGMNNWSVDGVNQLNQQWFWFRIGSGGPQFDISTISAPTITTLGTKQLTATYANAQYGVSVSYTLTGGTAGTGHSALTESINFYNYQTNASLDLHFFMYSDFVLGGPAAVNSQNAVLGSNTSVQTVPGIGASNTIAFPFSPADHTEVANSPVIYNGLTSVNNFGLNDSTSGGPGHITWAFEWDRVLAPATSLGTISITDTLQVPEPSVAGLSILALGAAMSVVRRRKGKSTQKEA